MNARSHKERARFQAKNPIRGAIRARVIEALPGLTNHRRESLTQAILFYGSRNTKIPWETIADIVVSKIKTHHAAHPERELADVVREAEQWLAPGK